MKKQTTKKQVSNQKFQNQFAWVKPMKVKKSANGNLLIFLNNTTAISLHPNFISYVMEEAA